VVWETLWQHYFRPQIGPDACVLDLGCGYGDFINAVAARRRIAVDAWPGMRDHLDPGVEAHVGSVEDLEFLADGSVDFALASNLFEHLRHDQLTSLLAQLARKLTASGSITLIQPNYRYAYREYFDDYTHISVFSHVSLADFLQVNGYDVIDMIPRFLPLTVKSRMPVSPLLIRAYLASPLRPFGKQMLLRARPRSATV
jgi:SAM-dependent methyltransferase